MEMNFLQTETAIKSRIATILETLNPRRSHCVGIEAEDDNSSTQFLRMQKNQLIDFQENFERYCKTLPVPGFNKARDDINLFRSYLLPILANERDIQLITIKKANLFVSVKFGNVQLLDISNFLGGATNLDSFLKAYTTSETKGFFLYEWFNHSDKLNDKKHPAYQTFHNELRNSNPLEKEHLDYEKLIGSGLATESALVKMRLFKIPPTGAQN